MKKLIIGSTLFLLSVSQASLAFGGAGKVYFHSAVGYATSGTKVAISNGATANFNPAPYGFGFGVGGSYGITDSIRLGADALWMYNLRDKKQSGSGGSILRDKVYIKQIGGFANAYYDLRTGSRFAPYITIGAGILRTEIEDDISIGSGAISSGKKSKLKMAFQGGGGLAYSVSSNIELELGYRAIGSKNNKAITYSNNALNLNISHKPAITHWGFVGARFAL